MKIVSEKKESGTLFTIRGKEVFLVSGLGAIFTVTATPDEALES